MELTHRFTVPTGVAETWAHFQDIASVAECFPGATVASVDGDTFSGSVKVKLGPIALVYNGSGTFVDKDEAAHRFVVDAKGKDKRGNGTAGAKVTLTMAPADAGATDVEVVTDLAITGKPAQFGRGVMQDVSDKLLGQFVACLEERLSGAGEPAGGATGGVASAGVATAGGVPTDETAASEPETQQERPWVSPPTPTEPSSHPAGAHRDDSLDLGTAVLPVLVRTYGKRAAAGLGGLLLLWWVVRRWRR